MSTHSEFSYCLHLSVLSSLAVAQPLYDLLSRYPEFFVARHSRPTDILLLVLFLTLLLPLFFVVVERIGGELDGRLQRLFRAIFLTLVLAIIALQVLQRIPGIPGLLQIAGALLVASSLCALYVRSAQTRFYLTVLSPAIRLFPALFLFSSPLYRILSPHPSDRTFEALTGANTPVVLVVFDELPLVSLLDENRQIDPIRYPFFASLARDSHWFRNATSISDSTLVSITAILTGSYPEPEDPKLPLLVDHRWNLFTLLAGSHELRVFENGTQLSPTTESRQSLARRLSSLFWDLSLVYAHLILPSELTDGLPTITAGWKNFLDGGGDPAGNRKHKTEPEPEEPVRFDFSDRSQKFYQFVDSIAATEEPGFYFFHSMLPHRPWAFTPSGKQYLWRGSSAVKGLADGKWGDDEWLAIQAQQRHLLQTGFVDKLLGNLIAKLKQTNLYERSLIILTSDHGISFRQGEHMRRVTASNHAALTAVPLLVKTPHQKEGNVSDRNLETIDIVPTVAQVLGIDLPMKVDGHSAFDHTQHERATKRAFMGGSKKYVFDARDESKYESVARKLELFGSGAWDQLYHIGPNRALLGRKVSEIGWSQAADVQVAIKGEAFYARMQADVPFIPVNIEGRLSLNPPPSPGAQVAVAINGRVRASSQTSPLLAGGKIFSAMVPETAFQPGQNQVETFLVSKPDNRLRLLRVASASRRSYRISRLLEDKREILLAPDGEPITVTTKDPLGGVRAEINRTDSRVFLRGWAVDLRDSRPVRSILVFRNGELLESGATLVRRSDIAKRFESSELLESGFLFEFPAALFEDPPATEVRVFAISNSHTASELRYFAHHGAEWPFAPPRKAFAPSYRWGSKIEFGREGDAERYQEMGWGNPENNFTWSLGKRASLVLEVPRPRNPVLLEAEVVGLGGHRRVAKQRIGIRINRRKVGEWILRERKYKTHTASIPADVWKDSGPNVILFETPDAVSPAEIAPSRDKRILGLAFRSLRLTEL
mgnify:CR=1 FL=1